MGSRMGHNDARTASSGLLECTFSVLLNGTGTISLTPVPFGTLMVGSTPGLLGDGLLPGGSFVYAGSAGTYTVTLSKVDNYRSVVYQDAILDDPTGQGQYANIGAMANQGSTSPLSFTLYTYAKTGTLTTFTGVRVFIDLLVKNGAVGS
jgi:hypothetical protein